MSTFYKNTVEGFTAVTFNMVIPKGSPEFPFADFYAIVYNAPGNEPKLLLSRDTVLNPLVTQATSTSAGLVTFLLNLNYIGKYKITMYGDMNDGTTSNIYTKLTTFSFSIKVRPSTTITTKAVFS